MAPRDADWMQMALSLARARLGQVAPNPAVGAVILQGARVLGRGVTGAGGRPHAEVVALTQARQRAGAEALRGATAYVTLEPCAHVGLTPPCASALIGAGIARVVCPIEDPDPRVSGRGIAAMRAAGITVEVGLLAAEARAVNIGFLTRVEQGRPHVTLKLAVTLDGRIATARGESAWITGEAARARVHVMRSESDAILVGAGTARADDPMLDVRGLGPRVHNPVRIVADPGLSLPLAGRLAQSARHIPVWLLHGPDADPARHAALTALGVETIPVATTPEGGLDMEAALARLADLGITRVLCEGGGTLAARLLADRLVDDIALFSAGKVFGGDGIASVQGFGLDRLADAPLFDLCTITQLGPDQLSIWRRQD